MIKCGDVLAISNSNHIWYLQMAKCLALQEKSNDTLPLGFPSRPLNSHSYGVDTMMELDAFDTLMLTPPEFYEELCGTAFQYLSTSKYH